MLLENGLAKWIRCYCLFSLAEEQMSPGPHITYDFFYNSMTYKQWFYLQSAWGYIHMFTTNI